MSSQQQNFNQSTGRLLAAPLPVQLAANMPGESKGDGPSTWAPATHVGDQNGFLGSWLQPGVALAIWIMKQQMESGTS